MLRKTWKNTSLKVKEILKHTLHRWYGVTYYLLIKSDTRLTCILFVILRWVSFLILLCTAPVQLFVKTIDQSTILKSSEVNFVFSYLCSYSFRCVLMLNVNKFYRIYLFCKFGTWNTVKGIAESLSHGLF